MYTMKSIAFFLVALTISLLAVSCQRDHCHACHYDLNGAEVEIGEYCGDELEAIEADGYRVDTITYEVHCHEH
jgi:hypothetical protein